MMRFSLTRVTTAAQEDVSPWVPGGSGAGEVQRARAKAGRGKSRGRGLPRRQPDLLT